MVAPSNVKYHAQNNSMLPCLRQVLPVPLPSWQSMLWAQAILDNRIFVVLSGSTTVLIESILGTLLMELLNFFIFHCLRKIIEVLKSSDTNSHRVCHTIQTPLSPISLLQMIKVDSIPQEPGI